MWNFDVEYKERLALAEEAVRKYLPKDDYAGRLCEAMCYAVEAGGKRIRPILVYEGYRLFGGEGEEVYPFMAALEYIHTHSLIHDDLPALDNDDTRRGRPATHKAFGEALGVLSGDALLNHAYEVMTYGALLTPRKENAIRAMQILAEKTGKGGMLGGQSVDVATEGMGLSSETLFYIYEKKTSALIEAGLMAGAALAGASEEDLALLEKAGRNLGLAFQIQDDVLDEEGSEAELGKNLHSDEKNEKTTSVSLFGLSGSKEMAKTYTEGAKDALLSLGRDTRFLEELFDSLMGRRK